MEVLIKSFDVEMKVKPNGVELEVRSNDGKSQIGDCFATKAGLVWCNGKTTKENGLKLSWENLQLLCASPESLKAALDAVKGLTKVAKKPAKPAAKAKKPDAAAKPVAKPTVKMPVEKKKP